MHKYSTEELVARKPPLEEFQKLPRNPIAFILHNIRSLENVGLFFRLADAIRAEKIYLTGYTGYPRITGKQDSSEQSKIDPREERIIAHAEKEINKTAIKLVPFVPWEQNDNVYLVFNKLRTMNYELVGVEQTDASVDYRLLPTDHQLPIALLFGHERTGIEEDLLRECSQIVHVPMLGMGNSHNVAMSACIICYHLLETLT